MLPCSPSPVLLRELLPLFGRESSGSIATYWKQTFCKARNQALSAASNIGQNCGGFSPDFSLCVSLCSLLGLGKLVLILLCFIQPCKQLTCVCLGCLNLLLFSFPYFAFCLCAVIRIHSTNPAWKHQLSLNLFSLLCAP